MKKTKKQLSDLITLEIKKNIYNKSFARENMNHLFDKYNISEEISTDILTLRTSPIDYSEYILFCVLDSLASNFIPEYFTESEINTYSKTQYKKREIELPIKFNMIQLTDDQFIGRITVKELMELRDAQLIKYNENTQRTLNKKIDGDLEFYEISINRKAVNAIVESFSNGSYIPNTITLNMPEFTEYKYSNGKLIINEIESFDIIDGYHRYIGMSSQYNINPDFDYPMELRVVCFSEEKAKQFIWQEDQKTKMRKVDSDAFNQNDPANQILNQINQTGLLKNVASQTGALDFSDTAVIIKRGYVCQPKISRAEIIEIRNYLVRKLNILLETDSNIFDNHWDQTYTRIAFALFKEDIADEDLLREINKFYDMFDTIASDDLKNRIKASFSTVTFNKIGDCYRRFKGI